MVEVDLARDSTLKDIAASLRIMAGANRGEVTNFRDFADYVSSGNAEIAFPIGDQLIANYKIGETVHKLPFDIVGYEDAELADGEIIRCAVLQAHYSPLTAQYSQYQAFYVAETAPLPAGTYHVTMGFNWGNVVNGKVYQFTLTQDLPVGGQLAGFYRAPDVVASDWRVYAYSSSTAASATETAVVTEGSGGVSLGTFTVAGSETLNSLHMVAYASNIYYNSSIRQLLNSSADIGAWWKPMSKWDRVPDQLSTFAGFLKGFDDDFLSVLVPGKVVTKLNTVTPLNTAGVPEFSYDKFFLPSKEEMYSTPQVSGEGHAWLYWKRVLGRTAPTANYQTYPEYKAYALTDKNSAQHLRWRSADVGNGYGTWYSYTSGYVTSSIAHWSYGCLPACRIGLKSK